VISLLRSNLSSDPLVSIMLLVVTLAVAMGLCYLLGYPRGHLNQRDCCYEH
jgi:hypothetical protein